MEGSAYSKRTIIRYPSWTRGSIIQCIVQFPPQYIVGVIPKKRLVNQMHGYRATLPQVKRGTDKKTCMRGQK